MKRFLGFAVFVMFLASALLPVFAVADAAEMVPMMALKKNESGDYGADLYLYDMNSGTMNTVAKDLVDAVFPRINAAQNMIVYTKGNKEISEEYTIQVYDVASMTTSAITSATTTEDSTDFDGSGKIIFIDYDNGVIKKMNTDGTGITTFATPESPYKFSVFWLSPDRQYIAAVENRQEGNSYETGNYERGVLISATDGTRVWTTPNEYLGEWNLLTWRPDSLAFVYIFHTFKVENGIYKGASPRHVLFDASSGQVVTTDLSNTDLGKKGQNICFFAGNDKLLSLNFRALYDAETGALLQNMPSTVTPFGRSMVGFDSNADIYFADMDGTGFHKFGETPKFAVTVSLSGTGSGTISADKDTLICSDNTCTGTFEKGTKVILTATSGSGSEFLGWGDGCKGKGKCTVVATKDVTVAAAFAKADPDITVLPAAAAVNFGKIKLNIPKAKVFRIINKGNADLTVGDVEVSGTDAAMFTSNFEQIAAEKKILKPKQSLNLTVTFKPTSAGARSATLTISSDDPDTPEKPITLGGTGK